MCFPFVTAKLRRAGDLHLEQGLPISHGNHIQTVLFREGRMGNKKRSAGLRFFNQIQVVLVLRWRMQW